MYTRSSARAWLILVLISVAPIVNADNRCSYTSYKWSTVQKKAVDFIKVNKRYSELTEVEIDQLTGCSVCEQDQREINITPLKLFKVCHLLAARVESSIFELIALGEPINTVTGYRVGMTRGKADQQGNRTQFSNHSFGIAIDINAEHNGLYTNCIKFSEACVLLRGGHWNPLRPESLYEQGAVVSKFKMLGFKWGGEIFGRQKDFMHFSPTGY